MRKDTPRELALEIKDLSKSFDGQPILKKLDLKKPGNSNQTIENVIRQVLKILNE